MNILITGATGYIGSHLVKRLSVLTEYRVYALVRPTPVKSKLQDILREDNIIEATSTFDSLNCAVEKVKPDLVIHTAALTTVSLQPEQVESIIDSNILYGTLLIEAMIKNGVCRFINTGTFWEHMHGADEYKPVNLYAASKNAFGSIIRYYEDAHSLSSVTLKLYGTYGPNDPRGKIFSLLKESVESKKQISMTPGEQLMDLVYIDDVVTAYEKTIEYIFKRNHCPSEVYFIGTGEGLNLRQLAAIYGECVGKSPNIKWGGIPYRKREVMDNVADIRPAKEKLGWEPIYELKKGITRMLQIESRN